MINRFSLGFKSTVATAGLLLVASASWAHGPATASLAHWMVLGQTPIPGNLVQADLNAAIDRGDSSFTLPAGTILLTQTLTISPWAKNFTLRGSGGTRLVRNSTADFNLLAIGTSPHYSFDNAAFADHPETLISPVARGATSLTRTGGEEVVPGWYAVVGANNATDRVTNTAGTPAYWVKREMVKVLSVSGTKINLHQPLGRAYDTPKLYRIQTATTETKWDVKVPENITVRDLTLDGRSAINNGLTTKIISVYSGQNIKLENVNLSGFGTAAASFQFCNGVTVNNARVTDGSTGSLGYGLEFGACRFVTVRNSQFSGHRWGTLFQFGTMDALVENCTYAAGAIGGFDAGHGCGEERITFRLCRAPRWSIANPGYLLGAKDVTLDRCTAWEEIAIYPNAENVRIIGKHPSEPHSFKFLQLNAEQSGQGFPVGTFYPKSVYLEGGSSYREDADGVNIQFHTLSGAPRGAHLLDVRDWSFTNPRAASGAAVFLRESGIQSNVSFTNCTFRNTYLYNSPIALGACVGNGSWNLSLNNCELTSNWQYGVNMSTGARGDVTLTNTRFNSALMSRNQIFNANNMNVAD